MNILDTELETARKIFYLLAHDYIFLGTYNEEIKDWDDGVYPAINCSDVFVPGADAENLHADDLDAYLEVVEKYGDSGSFSWCIVKRSSKPWRLTLDKNDQQAIKDIPWIIAKHSLRRSWSKP